MGAVGNAQSGGMQNDYVAQVGRHPDCLAGHRLGLEYLVPEKGEALMWPVIFTICSLTIVAFVVGYLLGTTIEARKWRDMLVEKGILNK
jgi:hypothetical protein